MNPPNHTELRIVKDLLRFMFEFVSGVMDQEGNSMNGQNENAGISDVCKKRNDLLSFTSLSSLRL